MVKKGITLKQQLIKNYGQLIGLKKLAEYKEKRKYQLSQKYYIQKYGYQLGKQKYKQFKEKTKFKITSQQCSHTLKFFIKKYGESLGTQKWNSYREKQAISNSFLYKNKKFGWTKQQFQLFNKSRAVTKENFIKKFGQQIGLEKWKKYCQKFKNHHSKIADQFFKYISTFNKENHKLFFGEKQKYFSPYFVDFFNENTNKVIEFFGIYWHANPKIYSQQKIINNKTAKEIWQKDKQRIMFLEKTYNLQIKIIWQNQLNNENLVNQLINWIYLN